MARWRQASQELVETVVHLNRTICEDLAEGHPAAFLLAASVVHSVGAPITTEPDCGDGSFPLGSLAESELAGLRAVGYALSRMIGTEQARQVVDKRLGGWVDELPDWLRRLDETKITGCWRGYDVHELFDTVGVGFRLSDDKEATLVVVASHHSDEILTAYVSSLSYADSGLAWARTDPSAGGMSWRQQEIARFLLEWALARSDPSTPTLRHGEHDGNQGQAEWAHYRALITWLVSLLDGEWVLPPLK